jgi:polar amino acid transport system substrate-binding protein
MRWEAEPMIAIRRFFLLYWFLLTVVGVVHAGDWDGSTVFICDDGAEWPPYTYYQRVDGKPTDAIVGFSIDVIDRIFDKRGIAHQVTLLPWKRCMVEVAAGKNYHMFLSGGRNPERERTYHISEAYYQMHPGYLYSEKQHPDGLAITNRKDLTKYRVCGIHGYNYVVFGLPEDQVDTGTSDYESLVKKLLTGRCDLSVDRLEILLGFKAIGKDFINHPDLVYEVIPGEPAEPFHMMFTKNALGRNLKQIVDEGIQELKGSGELEAIMENYSLLISSAAGNATQ